MVLERIGPTSRDVAWGAPPYRAFQTKAAIISLVVLLLLRTPIYSDLLRIIEFCQSETLSEVFRR